MTEAEALQQTSDALSQIDTNTTKAGTGVTAVQTRIAALLQQIADAGTLADAQALAAKAVDINARLAPIADSLTAMGQDPANPVPVPVPAPVA